MLVSEVAAAYPSVSGTALSALVSEYLDNSGGDASDTLTGTALSAELSSVASEQSALDGSYPLTGTAASAEASAFVSAEAAEIEAYVTGELSLSGTAASAASASFISEDAVFETAAASQYPALSGTALSAASESWASMETAQVEAYVTGVLSLSGTAASAAVASFVSEEAATESDNPDDSNANGPAAASALTGTAASATSALYESQEMAQVEAYVTGQLSLTGPAASAAVASFEAEITGSQADDPVLTGTAASAASASAASEYAALTASPTGPDKCGPKTPDPSVPDSCDTPVEQSTNNQPASYGVQCLNDTSVSTPINATSCSALIPELCANQWQSPGNWVWLTGEGCSLGSWLPVQNGGAAPWPSQAQCEQLIYVSMYDSCQLTGDSWTVAAVNLVVLPADSPVTQSGQQVNAGYPSYVIANHQLRTLSDQKDCVWTPPDNYCQGSRCRPASYYQSLYATSTPCAAISSPAVSFTPAAVAR